MLVKELALYMLPPTLTVFPVRKQPSGLPAQQGAPSPARTALRAGGGDGGVSGARGESLPVVGKETRAAHTPALPPKGCFRACFTLRPCECEQGQ